MSEKAKAIDPFDKSFSITQLFNKKTSHMIRDLKPNEKNIELKVIVVEKKENFMTRKRVAISSFLVADETGCIYVNFYSNSDQINPGDILYINGAYTSLFKDKMILYEGKKGLKIKIGEFFFNFSEEKNVSIGDWSDYLNKLGN